MFKFFSWGDQSPVQPLCESEKNDDLMIQMKDPIGFGQYSHVFKVERAAQKYACKQMMRTNDSQNHMLNLQNELLIMSQLKHPNIVTLKDKWRTEDYYYLLLEYCNAGDLKKVLKKHGGRLPENVVRQIALQVVQAIDHIHQQDIIHRDIKSSNLLVNFQSTREESETKQEPSLLTDKFEVKLADFGFARQLQQEETMNEFFGTLAYMAPEILTKQPYTRKVDIWSLGVTVFELVTGKHPFVAFSKSDLKFKHILGKYKVSNNLELSYQCLDFLNICLQYNPNNRASTQLLLNHQFLTQADSNNGVFWTAAASMNNLDSISLVALRIKNKDVIVLDCKDPQYFKRTCNSLPQKRSLIKCLQKDPLLQSTHNEAGIQSSSSGFNSSLGDSSVKSQTRSYQGFQFKKSQSGSLIISQQQEVLSNVGDPSQDQNTAPQSCSSWKRDYQPTQSNSSLQSFSSINFSSNSTANRQTELSSSNTSETVNKSQKRGLYQQSVKKKSQFFQQNEDQEDQEEKEQSQEEDHSSFNQDSENDEDEKLFNQEDTIYDPANMGESPVSFPCSKHLQSKNQSQRTVNLCAIAPGKLRRQSGFMGLASSKTLSLKAMPQHQDESEVNLDADELKVHIPKMPDTQPTTSFGLFRGDQDDQL